MTRELCQILVNRSDGDVSYIRLLQKDNVILRTKTHFNFEFGR